MEGELKKLKDVNHDCDTLNVDKRVTTTINEIEAEREKALVELLVKVIVRITLNQHYEKKCN